MFRTTAHARRRQAQRAIRDSDIEAALAWGRQIIQPDGREAFHLGRRSVARALRAGANVQQHRDVAVIVSRDGVVISVIRTPHLRRRHRS